MDPSSPDFSDLIKKYKVAQLGKNKPKMRYYPNAATQETKDTKSYEIFFSKDSKDFESIEEEVIGNYEHDVDDIMSTSFNAYVVRYAKDE